MNSFNRYLSAYNVAQMAGAEVIQETDAQLTRANSPHCDATQGPLPCLPVGHWRSCPHAVPFSAHRTKGGK